MDFNRQNIFQATAAKKSVVWDAGLRSYMLKVYNYMACLLYTSPSPRDS